MELARAAAVASSAVRARAKSEETGLVWSPDNQYAQPFSGGSNIHQGRNYFPLAGYRSHLAMVACSWLHSQTVRGVGVGFEEPHLRLMA